MNPNILSPNILSSNSEISDTVQFKSMDTFTAGENNGKNKTNSTEIMFK